MEKINYGINLEIIVLGKLQNNTYILFRDNSNECVIIDPSSEFTKIDSQLKKNKLSNVSILLTHGHFDHTGAVKELQENYGAKAYIHRDDAEKLNSTVKSYSIISAARHKICKADILLNGGEELNLAGIEFKVIATPGHSSGSVCYVSGNVIFAGDTVFKNSYGRYDFYDGSFSALYDSIVNKIFTLNGDYKIFCGHGESTTLDFERRYNPIKEDYNG